MPRDYLIADNSDRGRHPGISFELYFGRCVTSYSRAAFCLLSNYPLVPFQKYRQDKRHHTSLHSSKSPLHACIRRVAQRCRAINRANLSLSPTHIPSCKLASLDPESHWRGYSVTDGRMAKKSAYYQKGTRADTSSFESLGLADLRGVDSTISRECL